MHGRISQMAAAAIAIGLLVMFASACGGGTTTGQTTSTTSTEASGPSTRPGGTGGGGSGGGGGGGAKRIDGCLEPGGGVRRASFGSGAGRVSGAVVGAGPVAVAFANQSDRDLCGWVPLAKALARRGVESGLFDYSSVGSARELGAVADALRRGGADRVVVVGASVGGRAVITLGSEPEASLDQIVSLSGERTGPGSTPPDLLSDAGKVTSTPVLYVSSKNDGYTLFAEDTRRLYRATPAEGSRLLIVPGNDHGVDLLANARVRDAVVGAILGR